MSQISNNSLAFIALSNEYCQTLEQTSATSRRQFVTAMTRLLPRIYIAASDLAIDTAQLLEEPYIESRLEEDYYDAVRADVASLLGEDDTYLEVFEEDMKYSDTPIAASVAEGLADLFQVFYNFLEGVRDMPEHVIAGQLAAVRDDFDQYWSQTLCNVMRPLNHLVHNLSDDDADATPPDSDDDAAFYADHHHHCDDDDCDCHHDDCDCEDDDCCDCGCHHHHHHHDNGSDE